MLTQAEIQALHLRVLDRMVEARWLDYHIHTEGKGHQLAWTPEGGKRAMLLNELCEAYRLLDGDRAAQGFDVLANREALPPWVRPIEIPEYVAAYWRESIAQLGLRGDEDGLMVLVHILDGCSPIRPGK